MPRDRDRFWTELTNIRREAAEEGLMLTPTAIRGLVLVNLMAERRR